MAYATNADVAARTPGRPITASSKPSTAQIDSWITETEAVLNSTLLASDIPTGSFSADATNILKTWVVDRVSGLVRVAWASSGGDGGNDDGQSLLDKFDKLIDDIRIRPMFHGSMLAGGDGPAAARRMLGYQTDNDDALTIADGDFAPTFEKGLNEDQF